MYVSTEAYLSICLVLVTWLAPCWEARTLQVKEHEFTNLTCNGERAEWWIAPNQQIITFDQTMGDHAYMTDNLLIINSVETADEGIYSCAFRKNSTLLLSQVDLIVEPEIRRANAWHKYKTQFQIGLITAGVVSGVLLLGCLIYRFRWRDPNKKGYGDRDGLMPAAGFEGTIVDERF